MNVPASPPPSAGKLGKHVLAYARATGLAEARVRNWISYMMLVGALQPRSPGDSLPRFMISGGVALELRLRDRARATRDIDIASASPPGERLREFERALEGEYEGFRFARRGEPHEMPNGVTRLDLSALYRNQHWGRIQVDLSTIEAEQVETEAVQALPLGPFGLAEPDAVPCISVHYHIAQKLHALTSVPPEGRTNDRFRDVVDLLLLRELVGDYVALRDACENTFRWRNAQSWPPAIEVPAEWRDPYRTMAEQVGGLTTELDAAVEEIRAFVEAIHRAAD